MMRHRTGVRLRRLFPTQEGVWFDNTTPRIARTPSERLRPDLAHVRRTLTLRKPRFVVACGKQAEEVALEVWPGRLIVIPHPTWRPLSNFTLDLVRERIRGDDFDRLVFTQTKHGSVIVGPIGPGGHE